MNQTIKTTPCSIHRAYEKPAMHIIPLDAEAVMAASTDYGVTEGEGGYNGPVYNPKRFWNSTSLSLGEEDEPQ